LLTHAGVHPTGGIAENKDDELTVVVTSKTVVLVTFVNVVIKDLVPWTMVVTGYDNGKVVVAVMLVRAIVSCA